MVAKWSARFVVKLEEPLEKPIALGIESIVNLLAPLSPIASLKQRLATRICVSAGPLPAATLRMEDGWQRVRVVLTRYPQRVLGRAN